MSIIYEALKKIEEKRKVNFFKINFKKIFLFLFIFFLSIYILKVFKQLKENKIIPKNKNHYFFKLSGIIYGKNPAAIINGKIFDLENNENNELKIFKIYKNKVELLDKINNQTITLYLE